MYYTPFAARAITFICASCGLGQLLLAVPADAQTAKPQDQRPDRGGPEVGTLAPDVILFTATDRRSIHLRHIIDKPTVLLFGSYSCPFFGQYSNDLERLTEKYRGRANVFVIYTVEAHAPPVRTLDERAAAALSAAQKLHLSAPMFLDSIDDQGVKIYDSRSTIRMYILDKKGRIVHKSPKTPYLIHIPEAAPILDKLLNATTGQGKRSNSSPVARQS